MKLIVPSATPVPLLVRQSKSPQDREIGRRLAPLWAVLAPKLQENFPDGDARSNFIFPALDARAEVLSIYDRGVGNKCSSLHHQDTTNCSISLLLICVNLVVLILCCDRLLVKQALRFRIARPVCGGCSFRLLAFSPLGESRPFFFALFPFLWHL